MTREFSSFVELFRHIGLFHQNDRSFQLSCNLHQSCGSSYKTYSAYKSHIYRHHSDFLQASTATSLHTDFPLLHDILAPLIDELDPNVLDEIVDDGEEPMPQSTATFVDGNDVSMRDIEYTYVRFLLQLREEFLLPQKIIQSISSNIVTLFERVHGLLEQKSVSSALPTTTTLTDLTDQRVVKTDVLAATIREVSQTIEATTRNEYQFLKSCEQMLDYRPPRELVLSGSGDKVEYGYIIPIAETLTSVLRSQELFSLLLDNVVHQQQATINDNDLMFSIRDGNLGARIDDDSLLLQLYTDDIGLTNPIGPKKDSYKMTMVYFLLEDMPDKYRSQLQSIHLLGICRSNALKVYDRAASYRLKSSIFSETIFFGKTGGLKGTFGVGKVLNPFDSTFVKLDNRFSKDVNNAKRFFQAIVTDINILQEQGLIINGVHVKFSISTVAADNLAAHSLGGYQASFSSGYFCRRCYVTYADRILPLSPTSVVHRSSFDHDKNLQRIATDPTQIPLFGIVGPSVLADLDGFHPTTSLPGDIMHDFLEGSCPLVIMALLKEASASRLITYSKSIVYFVSLFIDLGQF
jgi:hypothetical protein